MLLPHVASVFARTAAALSLATWIAGCGHPCELATAGNLNSFPGCSGDAVSVYGFRPLEPAFTIRNRFPSASSLKPTLRWEPSPFMTGNSDASNIRYDLIIWKGVGARHADADSFYEERLSRSDVWVSVDSLVVVYERHGLPEASHTVEAALEPNTEYAWSVRARFELNGRTRVSEWSLVAMSEPSSYATYGGGGYDSRQHARLTAQVPPYALYYFTTPRR